MLEDAVAAMVHLAPVGAVTEVVDVDDPQPDASTASSPSACRGSRTAVLEATNLPWAGALELGKKGEGYPFDCAPRIPSHDAATHFCAVSLVAPSATVKILLGQLPPAFVSESLLV